MKLPFTKSPKHVKSLESKKTLLEDGEMMEKSSALERQEECGCLICPQSTQPSKHKTKTSTSSIQECPHKSKKTILNVKKNTSDLIYLSNIPDSSLIQSQTSDQASTSRDPGFYKFWDSLKRERYLQLSWLQETEWQGLDSNSSNGCVQNLEPKSWFSIKMIQPQNQNCPKTSWQSSKFIAVDGMAKEDIPKEKIKCRKLKLRPTPQQAQQLNQWAGCYRFLYNKTIGLLTNKDNTTLRNVYKIRNKFVTMKGKYLDTENNFYVGKDWLKECPKSIKQGAIQEAKANYDACWTNMKGGNITHFVAPFKSKKKELLNGWSLSLEKSNMTKKADQLFIYKRLLGEMKYFKTKQLHKLIPYIKPDMDCKIQRSKFGEYFLIIPYVCKPKPLVTKPKNPVSVDTGIRKYATTYAPNARESFMIGNRWATRIMDILFLIDKLQSVVSKEKDSNKRKVIKRKIISLRKKIHYLKSEMMFKIADFLVKRYDLIMIPKLDTKRLVIKAERRLTTKTARSLLAAGHSRFFGILKDKCWEHGIIFLHCREEYTSQTCPCCGHLNKCNELYKCKDCGFVHDRDIVGALNIMLKGVRVGDKTR